MSCFLRIFFAWGLIALSARAQDQDRWWPVQSLPKAVVRTKSSGRADLEMMVQSVAGLAAKAVNEGRGDELVWVDNGNADMEEWYVRFRATHPDLKEAGNFDAWAVVERYAKRGTIKGYILYRRDTSQGDLNSYRQGMDCSVNVATSLAGVRDGMIVDEELEAEAKAHGLELLLDVRGKSQQWCFETYQRQFTRQMLCTQDPKKPHVRDFAIAQKAFTIFGKDEPTRAAMAWLEPLSPILGWNGGDEFQTTDLSSRYGHIQTATDWCMNLPVLMAGAEKVEPVKLKAFDPALIDWGDHRSAVSFIQTDGDNVQWLEGNFFGNASYWGNPERGRIPFGWSACLGHLAQLCPETIAYAEGTRTARDTFIEWGGGYYFPDHFGMERTNRWELLAHHARRTGSLMKKTGTRIIGFNVARCDSPDAFKAYEVIASQTEGILGILVFQYDPYEAGAGKIWWVKDRKGIDLPVMTARYAIWEHANQRARAGTPAKVAREIRETIEKSAPEVGPRYDWVITHAWSYFRKAKGNDEDAENVPQANPATEGAARGYLPVTWCAERLAETVRVVSPEELLWRLRMKRAPDETKRLMKEVEW